MVPSPGQFRFLMGRLTASTHRCMCLIFNFLTQSDSLTVWPVVSLFRLVAELRSLRVWLRTLIDVLRYQFRCRILYSSQLYIRCLLTNLFPSQTTNHWQSKSSSDSACSNVSVFGFVTHHVRHYSRCCCYSTVQVLIWDCRPWPKLRLWTRHPLWRLVYLVITKHWTHWRTLLLNKL